MPDLGTAAASVWGNGAPGQKFTAWTDHAGVDHEVDFHVYNSYGHCIGWNSATGLVRANPAPPGFPGGGNNGGGGAAWTQGIKTEASVVVNAGITARVATIFDVSCTAAASACNYTHTAHSSQGQLKLGVTITHNSNMIGFRDDRIDSLLGAGRLCAAARGAE